MSLKRTSPGPKIGPTGASIGAPKNVGTTGADKTTTSTSGGQHSFMPSPKSTMTSAKTKSGQSSSPRTDNLYDFIPKKPESKK